MSEQEQDLPILQWHDLSANEVYPVALMEYQTRESIATVLHNVHLSADSLGRVALAQGLLVNNEARAASWLADRALLRGMRAESPAYRDSVRQMVYKENASVIEPEEIIRTGKQWLDTLLTGLGLNQRELAQKTGVVPSAISRIRKGNRIPTPAVTRRLCEVIADEKGLIGVQREMFIEDNMSFIARYRQASQQKD